ncbi:MFS transporter [Pseudomonas aeruginosa]
MPTPDKNNKIDVQAFIDAQAVSAFQLRVLSLCFLIVAMDGFDTAAIGFIAPALAHDWQLSPAQLSPILGAALAGLALGAFAAGPLADRFGRKSVLLLSVLFFGGWSLASAYAGSVETLALLRFFTGLGLGGAMPNAITLTSEYCPRRHRALMVTAMFCGFTLGSALGGLLAARMVPALGWESVLLLGGGCVEAAAEARALAAALDAPTALTINAKGLLPADHPLLLGSNQSCVPVRELAAEADVVLAIGTELGETDYDVVFDGGFALDGELIRIDIDPQQLMRNYTPSLAIHSDARLAMRVLLAELPGGEASPDSPGARRAAAVRQRLAEDFAGWSHYRQLFAAILAEWPDARFVGDSTQTVYSGNHLVDLDEPRRWFNASTGYGTLGYGLPAAIGAKLGEPGRPVVSLMGDGGLQFTLPELASAVEAKVGIVVLLWNNHGYGEIKRYMERREITPLGVDIYTPDFLAIARGFGCAAERARDLEHLRELLRGAPADRPLIVEVLQAAPFHP